MRMSEAMANLQRWNLPTSQGSTLVTPQGWKGGGRVLYRNGKRRGQMELIIPKEMEARIEDKVVCYVP
jgi:hypothetical protein